MSKGRKLYWVAEENHVKVYDDKYRVIEIVPIEKDVLGNEFAVTSTIGLIIVRPKRGENH